MTIKFHFFLSHGGIEQRTQFACLTPSLSLSLFYSFFRMTRPFDVVIVAAAAAVVVAILFNGGGADAECANCERRINEWCCETGWRGRCCEFPLQGGLTELLTTWN